MTMFPPLQVSEWKNLQTPPKILHCLKEYHADDGERWTTPLTNCSTGNTLAMRLNSQFELQSWSNGTMYNKEMRPRQDTNKWYCLYHMTFFGTAWKNNFLEWLGS